MTHDDLQAIEEQLGLVLPQVFIDAAVSGAFSDPLHDDPGSIVAINRAFRDGEYGDQDWPPNLLAFGHDGGGNYFCIDVQQTDAGVFLRDHETLDLIKAHESLNSFLQEWM